MLVQNGGFPPTNKYLMTLYHDNLLKNIKDGSYRPIILPYDGLGVVILITYLCIPHTNRPWLYALRWPVAAFIVAFHVDMMRSTRSSFMGSGFGVGLIASWLLTWSITWLIFNDPQKDAKRVERRRDKVGRATKDGESNGVASGTEKYTNGDTNGNASRRKQQNGQHNGSTTPGKTDVNKDKPAEFDFFWQSYPLDSILARIDWVQDLVHNFRGPGWNWELPSNPGLPPHVLASLGESPSSAKSIGRAGIRRYKTRSELARHIIPQMLRNYLLLDFLKVLLMTDGYFLFGIPGTSLHTPAYLAPLPSWLHPLMRRSLSGISIITALETIFPLAPLFFSIILGPKVLGLRGEAWMYPSTWGGLSIIGEQGLNGLWSGWWHQTFRFAFVAPTQYLIKKGVLAPRAKATKIFGLVVAFAISGFLHASGSYTQTANTKPLHPIVFFMLQAVGIVFQTTFCSLLHQQLKHVPKHLRYFGNFTFTLVWLYITSPWLVDDFASGGIWLFEPVPISPIRALGFGNKDDSWWCWDFSSVGWYRSEKWWLNGLAF